MIASMHANHDSITKKGTSLLAVSPFSYYSSLGYIHFSLGNIFTRRLTAITSALSPIAQEQLTVSARWYLSYCPRAYKARIWNFVPGPER